MEKHHEERLGVALAVVAVSWTAEESRISQATMEPPPMLVGRRPVGAAAAARP